ncbi:MAG TPA: pyrroline-5-carboxylate reductase [Solimonas sp.]
MQQTIAFIGGGNMAASLIGGLIAAGHPVERLRVAEPVAERADWLRRQFGLEVRATAAEVVPGAGALVLAVKPQQMGEALAGLQADPGCVVISVAAGVRLARLRRALGEAAHYVRTMPNTPALIGKGITGLYAVAGTPDAARKLAEAVLATAGATVWLNREEDIDAVTALSGSGPAYFFLLTEALREAGEKLGLAPDTAARLALHTFAGSAQMAAAEGARDVVELRAQVTSKGGTTEAAVKSLEAAGLRRSFDEALAAAANRSRELGDLLDAQD